MLDEFTSVPRRKLKLSWGETEEVLQALKTSLDVVPLTLGLNERAVAFTSAHDLNIYEASIIAAALKNECDAVLSQEIQSGKMPMGLLIASQFL